MTPEMEVPQDVAGLRRLHSGKVRDLYEYPDGRLLMVASDRISAYDFVLTPEIPDKGKILTQLSLWWFDQFGDIAPSHVLSTDVPDGLDGRAVVCEPLSMVKVECVARGYLAGSGWSQYQATGAICGVVLPEGLIEGSRLPTPIFTPTTKAPLGEHDEPMTFDEVVGLVGGEMARRLREVTLKVYERGEERSRRRGILLADTKVELGLRPDGTLVLADEILTPDSSRFWPVSKWRPGRPQPSYDKQFVRDWLTSAEAHWDRASGEPPPPLPPAIVDQTRATYVEAYERLTGETF
ncbi:MAG TPA: phosphoribosylaminoimidazolesuccinocarboxamide synthase [Nocardioidaceae bacterium]|nr:phosphoribosylaminoimidazolesuccinocarboxamide synthase [Nocardioidaceae bacterium]